MVKRYFFNVFFLNYALSLQSPYQIQDIILQF